LNEEKKDLSVADGPTKTAEKIYRAAGYNTGNQKATIPLEIIFGGIMILGGFLFLAKSKNESFFPQLGYLFFK
jgi:hypothetical protein